MEFTEQSGLSRLLAQLGAQSIEQPLPVGDDDAENHHSHHEDEHRLSPNRGESPVDDSSEAVDDGV